MKNSIRLFSLLFVVIMLIGCAQTGVYNPLAIDTTGTPDTTTDTEADTTSAEEDTINAENNAANTELDVRTASLCIDYLVYRSLDALVNMSTNIYEGKITDITFAIINDTGEIATKNDDIKDMLLYTIYEVEVSASYKGQNEEKVYVYVPGGKEGYKESEQLALCKEYMNYTLNSYILVLDIPISLTIGKTYMFCTLGPSEQYQGIVSNYQAIYDPEQPDAKLYNFFSYNDVKSYLTSMQEDER